MKRIAWVVSLIVTLMFPAYAGSKGVASPMAAEKEMEEYAPKMIIEAAWGNGAGEYGYLPVYGEGPGCFDVAPNGKIYVLDQVNGRINVHTGLGRFEKTITLEEPYQMPAGKSAADFRVDGQGRIFICSDYDEFFVDKYDGSGILLKRYVVYNRGKGRGRRYFARDRRTVILNFKDIEVNAVTVCQDKDRNVYMIAGEKEAGSFRAGKYSMISDTTSLRSWKELDVPGRIGREITERYGLAVDTQTDHLVLSIADTQAGRTEKLDLKLPGPDEADGSLIGSAFGFLGDDNRGNVYVERRDTADTGRPTGDIYKFTRQGELVSRIEMGRYFPVIIDTRFTGAGNLYCLAWNSNYLEAGVRVARWDKVPAPRKPGKAKAGTRP